MLRKKDGQICDNNGVNPKEEEGDSRVKLEPVEAIDLNAVTEYNNPVTDDMREAYEPAVSIDTYENGETNYVSEEDMVPYNHGIFGNSEEYEEGDYSSDQMYFDSPEDDISLAEQEIPKTKQNKSKLLSNTVHECKQCSEKFLTKPDLKHHIQSVHGGIRFECTICNEQFLGLTNVKSHIQSIHSGQGGVRFSCGQCGYKCSDRSQLSRHIKTVHEGLRFPCNQCPQQFTKRCNLKTHILAVHDLVKFECEECGFKTTHKSHLRMHIKSTHKGIMYSCSHCDYKAAYKSHVDLHRRSVHEGMRHKCQYCDHTESNKTRLAKHVQIAHVVELIQEFDKT